MRAENLRFKEEGVKGIVKDVLLPWYNAYRFLSNQLETDLGEVVSFDPFNPPLEDGNVMDRWILSAFESLLATVKAEMAQFHLYAVVPPLLKFIESLTNWYIRFNRRRLKGDQGREEMMTALHVLFSILYRFAIVMAPFTPFLAENLYQKLRPYANIIEAEGDWRSVHFLLYPKGHPELIHPDIERAMGRLQEIVERVRMLRENRNIPIKTPLRQVLVVTTDPLIKADLESLSAFILEELNVRDLVISEDEATYGIGYVAVPNFKELGGRLKKDFGAVQAAIKALQPAQLRSYLETGQLAILPGINLSGDDLEVIRMVKDAEMPKDGFPLSCYHCARDHVVFLDVTIDEDLRTEGLARELVNRVQRLRKKAGLKASDEVRVHLSLLQADPEGMLETCMDAQMDSLVRSLKGCHLSVSKDASKMNDEPLAVEETAVGGGMVEVRLLKLQ